MTDQPPPPSLEELGARLQEARRKSAVDPAASQERASDSGALGFGFRISVDLVAALVVGVGGGWLLDRWLGTSPWGLIVLFFLGAGAGVINVYRAVSGYGYAVGYRRPVSGRKSRGGRGAAAATKAEGEERRG